MITFEKIVHKLWKMEWEIITYKDIWLIIDPDFLKNNQKYKDKVYKIIYRLKSNQIIHPIRNSLYYICNKKEVKEVDIIDSFYWKIVKKIIQENTMWDYIIWWNKSLELYLKDFSIQNQLIVYTKDIEKIITISKDHKIIFKNIKWWQKNKKLDNFTFLKKFIKKIQIDSIQFNICNEELAILDTLLIRNNQSKINNYLIDKFLTKFSNYLDRDIMWLLVSYRYITSINRLRVITQQKKNSWLYEKCLDIIKKEWWNCFLAIKD